MIPMKPYSSHPLKDNYLTVAQVIACLRSTIIEDFVPLKHFFLVLFGDSRSQSSSTWRGITLLRLSVNNFKVDSKATENRVSIF